MRETTTLRTNTAAHYCRYCSAAFGNSNDCMTHENFCDYRVIPHVVPVQFEHTDERLSNREREILQTALRFYHNDLQDVGMDTDAAIAARLSLRLADPSKELVLAEVS